MVRPIIGPFSPTRARPRSTTTDSRRLLRHPKQQRLDHRAGLAELAARAVAAAVVEIRRAGWGTCWWRSCRHRPRRRWLLAQPVRYLGPDVSRPMLEVFRRHTAGAPLAQADAALPWPLPDGAAARLRLARPPPAAGRARGRGAFPGRGRRCLRRGWVERPPESVKGRLAREMRRRLRERVTLPDRREASAPGTLPRPRRRELPRTVAAAWPACHSPRRASPTGGGRTGSGASPATRRPGGGAARAGAWAAAAYGGLDADQAVQEEYVLEGVRLDERRRWPPSRSRRPDGPPPAAGGALAVYLDYLLFGGLLALAVWALGPLRGGHARAACRQDATLRRRRDRPGPLRRWSTGNASSRSSSGLSCSFRPARRVPRCRRCPSGCCKRRPGGPSSSASWRS